ncbi:DUF881 domain-containing protein [Haloimpatiens sp. FM7315]|uniref:DUF881 domain-containing protein n=1 Tax=Haloimpatiens sp. FM7315 TaxID=3298609 RepID=UPI0035A2FBDA
MRTNESHVFLFISCIIIGILISLNIDLKKDGKNNFLNASQYQDAYNERSKLYNEISDLQKQYNRYNSKFLKYNSSEKNKYEIVAEIESELKENKTKLGMEDVEGEGIVITINDAVDQYNATGNEDYLVHFYDLIFLINDLKNSGAEAISVNGQRVIDGTYDYCGGSNINLNGVKIVAPFYISVIGNKEVIKQYMLMNENYLKYLMIVRKISAEIKVEEELKIDAYIGTKKYKYAKLKINK